MSNRRLLTALAAATLVASAAAAPASAGKSPPKAAAPTFRVALSKDVLSGDNRRTDLAFQFTSTGTKGAPGQLRLTIPVQQMTNNSGQTFNVGWGKLQNTRPSDETYFRVDNGTCTSASLIGFVAQDRVVNQTIDVAFQCDRGQSFAIAFFPRSTYWNVAGDTSIADAWAFPIQTRFRAKDAWAAQPAKHLQVEIHPLDIELPSFNIVPPQVVVPTVVTPVEDDDPATTELAWIFMEAPAQITDVHTAQVSFTVGQGTATKSGRLVQVANPGNLVNDTRVELVVTGLPGTGFTEVKIFAPPETFSYVVKFPGEGDYVLATLPMTFVVVDGNPLSRINDRKEGIRCAQAGGEFKTPILMEWLCSVPASLRTAAEAEALRVEFEQYGYCATLDVSVQKVVDTSGERWEYICHT